MGNPISNKRHLIQFLIQLTIPAILCGCGTLSEPTVTTQSIREAEAAKLSQVKAPAVPATNNTVESPIVSSVSNRESRELNVIGATVPAATEPAEVSADDNRFADIPENSVWARIRAGLKMPKMDADLTGPHERWFVENAEFREAMFERSKLYLYYIVEEVEKRGLPMEIALLPAIESAYKPYAYSRARASGLWQFIPSTGRLYGLKNNWWYDGRRDVIASTRAALDYLEKLRDDFDGDWQLALAAYNAGEGRVGRAIEQNRRKGLGTNYVSLRQLKQETRQYVPKLMAMVNIVTNPRAYGVALPEIPNEPYFASVDTTSQVDLGVVARLTGMEPTDLYHINPGYTRWATDPNGPHQVLVPVDKRDALVAGLSNLPQSERVQWQHHEVRHGDTLHSIARSYRMTVEAIKAANKLTSGVLRTGQSLLLPISANAVLPPAAAAPAKPIRTVAKSTNRPTLHRVRPGETLSSIARRYNVMVRQLADWNSLKPGEVLRMGQRLKIFGHESPSA
ncbi:MAG: transglycosylase SLT domain-containing protein [Gammaproteobacteria bacterium]|nr:transglycosylase SLT domain-containing protein [Gammaproteobacteria bacterium]